MKHLLTHPGGAHKDDFLACCLLLAKHPVPIERRNPTAADLDDSEVAVIDVGGRHEPERCNFDHHQFPHDHEPVCSLSLVMRHMGIYEDARDFCDWLEPAEWLDARGPGETAKWLGVERRVINQLVSPMDVTLLRRFAQESELKPGDLIWEMMRLVGEDLLTFVLSLRERLEFIGANSEHWRIAGPHGEFDALFLRRTEPLPSEPSMGIERYVERIGMDGQMVALVYPDRRGSGYGLSRYRDHQAVDFTRIEAEADVHFAHARGFVAKSSAIDPERLQALLAKAQVEA